MVIWKVVFPSGIELNGTAVGETSPNVCIWDKSQSMLLILRRESSSERTLKGENIFDPEGVCCGRLSSTETLCRFARGIPKASSPVAEGIVASLCCSLRSRVRCDVFFNIFVVVRRIYFILFYYFYFTFFFFLRRRKNNHSKTHATQRLLSRRFQQYLFSLYFYLFLKNSLWISC